MTIDDAEIPAAAALLPRKVNPGAHSARVVAAGYKEARVEATVVEGEVKTAHVTLEVDPAQSSAAPPPSPLVVHEDRPPTLIYAGFGAGAAGLVVGSIFGLMSLGRASDAERFCEGDRCTSEARPDKEAAIDLANVSNVGFAIALVGAGVGIYGLVTRPKARAGAWIVTPFGARGSF